MKKDVGYELQKSKHL